MQLALLNIRRHLKWGFFLPCFFLLACSQPPDHKPATQHFAFNAPLPAPTGKVLLSISGQISRTNAKGKAEFDRQMLEALPHHSIDTDTSVTDGMHHFEGVLMRDLLKRVGAKGDTVTLGALNDYVIDVPVADFKQYDVIAAWSMDGKTLTPRDKGPLWVVYPRADFKELRDIRYDYRWAWQLVRITVK